MSATVINVIIDDECYVMPVKRKKISGKGHTGLLPCLHCGSTDAWTVLVTRQIPMFNATPEIAFHLIVCPDCQCASEYRI